MKSKLHLFQIFIVIFLLFVSCEKDNLHSSDQNEKLSKKVSKTKPVTSALSFKSLDEFTQDDQEFKNYFQKVVPSNQTFSVENQRKIYHIDSTNVTKIEKDSTVTYTMLLRNTKLKEGAFKNLVIEFNLQKNTKKAYVIKYIPDKNGLVYRKQHDSYGFKGNVSVKEINLNKSKLTTFQRDCRLVYVTVCNWGGTEHIAGPNCTSAYMYDILVADCPNELSEPEHGGGGTYGGNPPIETGPEEGGGGGSNGGINTVPVLPDVKEAQDFVIAHLQLTGLERNWIRDAQHGTFVRELQDFLQGNLTSEAIAFAEKAVEIKLHHPEFHIDIARSFDSPYNIDLDAVKPNPADPKPEKEKFIAIYDTLTNTPLFKNLFKDTFGENPNLNVKFEIANSLTSPTDPTVQDNGQTFVESGTLNSAGQLTIDIVIKINKQSLVGANAKAKIIIARTILHESIHAFLDVKKLQSDAGATLPDLNNQDLSQLINEVYNGFGNNNSDQHAFMFDHLVPALADNLALLKDDLISQDAQNYAESLNFGGYHDGIDIPDTPFNWDDFFTNISMEGLYNTQAFQDEIGSDPVKKFIWEQYVTLAGQI